MSPPRQRLGLLALCLLMSASAGCSTNAVTDDGAPAFDEASCEPNFEARVSRTGKQDMARLSYACAADLCDASEPFASGSSVLAAIDLPTASAQGLTVESQSPGTLKATLLQANYDACLGQTRAYVMLDAVQPGEATLLVTADGLVDELMVRVARAASIGLQVSPLSQLAFSKADEAQTLPGEPLLVVPSLLDADGSTLIGIPALSWSVDDARIAAVRADPSTEDERFLRDLAAANAVFVDGKMPGLARLRVITRDGVEGALSVRVLEPEASVGQSLGKPRMRSEMMFF